ncbi:MAG: hypothetical protein ACRDGU_08890 [Actinomycetota bacterium]
MTVFLGMGCSGANGTKDASTSATSASEEGFISYTDATYRFKIAFPNTWDKQEGEGLALGSFRVAVMFLAPLEEPSDDFRENVNVGVQMLPDESMTLDDYTELSVDQAPLLITGFELLEQSSATLSGQPAHQMHYRGAAGDFPPGVAGRMDRP